eukprot:TRINITY_DN90428_c0_g1_i1.p1 TRINITY_DN90428_c0_g1~~TRINITY_DN90428_c0_g1_i1.p1  ORF type:complete len:1047 (+),score=228.38 TRINITY_DN90428_c0_g1_i1:119-3259(+)
MGLGDGRGDSDRGLRLGCLELYVHLTAPADGIGLCTQSGGSSSSRAGFSVGQDDRGRVLVRGSEGGSKAALAAAGGDGPPAGGCPQTWQVSAAFLPQDTEAAMFDVMGLEAVDWLWDGLSVVMLGVGSRCEAKAAVPQPLFGQSLQGGLRGNGGLQRSQPRHGVLGLCIDEICRRASAGPDLDRFCLGLSLWELAGSESWDLLASPSEDCSGDLRFETVQFQTAAEAMMLMDTALCQGPRGSMSRRTSGGAQRHHLFLRVVIFDALRESLAAIHFAQIASGTDAGTAADDRTIASDRLALWSLLEQASSGEPVDLPDENSSGQCRLTEVLGPLISGNCKPFLLCSVPEHPKSAAVASESHGLLDLAERASLTTTQCTCVQGVKRNDFQLASFDGVLRRLRQGPGLEVVEPEKLLAEKPVHTNGVAAKPPSAPASPAVAEPVAVLASASLASAPPPQPASEERQHLPPSPTPELATNRSLSFEPSVCDKRPAMVQEARNAHDACVEECRELSVACAALRARNEAKAARRSRELEIVRAEVASMRKEIISYEDACEAPQLVGALREELVSLRQQAERLREQNAVLAGSRDKEARRQAQRAALHSMQEEARHLQQEAAGVEQAEKRANLVHRCLSEVSSRLEVAKRRLSAAQESNEALQPLCAELGRKLEQAERQRRWVYEELDKLRRASTGLRAEVQELHGVRSAIAALPLACSEPPAVDMSSSNEGSGLERFAALQRRLSHAAPQLVPLATRAHAEMVELTKCCQRLEDRQRRLEKVVPVAQDLDTTDACSVSCSSSVASGFASRGSARRARSSDERVGFLGRSHSQELSAGGVASAAGRSGRLSGRSTPRGEAAGLAAKAGAAALDAARANSDAALSAAGFADVSGTVRSGPAATPGQRTPRTIRRDLQFTGDLDGAGMPASAWAAAQSPRSAASRERRLVHAERRSPSAGQGIARNGRYGRADSEERSGRRRPVSGPGIQGPAGVLNDLGMCLPNGTCGLVTGINLKSSTTPIRSDSRDSLRSGSSVHKFAAAQRTRAMGSRTPR